MSVWSNPVKAWTDPARWAQLVTETGCPFCQIERLEGVYIELVATWALLPKEAILPGYVLLLSKRHVLEPYELEPAERARFWQEVDSTARAISTLLRPVKMNYEIHGNTVPHLHMHLLPRYRGDPFERSQMDPHSAEPFVRSGRQLNELRDAIRAAFPDRPGA